MQSFKLQKSGDDSSSEQSGGGQKTVGSVLGIFLIIGAVWYFWGGGIEVRTEQITNDINQQVISDVLQQYNIAKANGTKIDACVRAGLVAEAYLQAHDERNYSAWKNIEFLDCDEAGVPIQ